MKYKVAFAQALRIERIRTNVHALLTTDVPFHDHYRDWGIQVYIRQHGLFKEVSPVLWTVEDVDAYLRHGQANEAP